MNAPITFIKLMNNVYQEYLDKFVLVFLNDILIYSYEMLYFMDEFSRYNKIKIAPKDQHKMDFITPWRIFCYKVMPFNPKNVGATYQHAMMYIFHNYMHNIMKDYIDDVLAKSKNR